MSHTAVGTAARTRANPPVSRSPQRPVDEVMTPLWFQTAPPAPATPGYTQQFSPYATQASWYHSQQYQANVAAAAAHLVANQSQQAQAPPPAPQHQPAQGPP